MSRIQYVTSDRKRICRLCDDAIVPNTWAIVFKRMHVSPKVRDLHFHEGCLMRAMDQAKQEYGTCYRRVPLEAKP